MLGDPGSIYGYRNKIRKMIIEKHEILVCAGVICGFFAYVFIKWLLSKVSVGCYDSKYVFITGCDSGFGNRLARRLDTMGFKVFAACWSQNGGEELNRETSDNLKVLCLFDITNDSSIERAFCFVCQNLPENKGLWALVNNAGCHASGVGPVEWHKRDVYKQVFDVNLFGMIEVTRRFLPLVRKARGRIVNMSSMSALFGTFGVAPYAMTKYAVEGFSDCLRVELRKQGVSVHVIQPGGFKTTFTDEDRFIRMAQASFENLEPDLKTFYGRDYTVRFCDSISSQSIVISDNLDLVINSYVHAITSFFPQDRYAPGNYFAKCCLVLTYLPTWLVDVVTSYNVVLPVALIQDNQRC